MASSSSVSLTDVELERVSGTVTTDQTSNVTRRSASTKTAHTRMTTEVDIFGNQTTTTAFGCTEGCTPADESITTVTLPGRNADDTSGWQWRTVESYVTGSDHPGKRSRKFMTYTSAGDLLETTAELSDTLPLDRTNDAGKAPAPPPSDASGGIGAPTTILLAHDEHDSFGNVTQQRGSNGRCRFFGHEEPYAELTTSETVRAGTIPTVPPGELCGSVALATSATYDRGFGLVTDVIDLHGEPTTAAYDAFSRLISLTRSSPYITNGDPPTLSDLASVKVEYFLPADWTKTPYSLVHTQTQDGTDHDVDSYQKAWGYVDGLGRTLLTLAEADPNAGDGGDFVANGFVDYDKKGAARRAFLAFFFTGDPTKFPLGTTPSSPYGSQRYDAFGRQLETFGLDGSMTLRSVYHALSQDKWDAADLAPGPHQGTPASLANDGHGRATVLIERIHNGTSIEARETRSSYLPTGEVETMTRHRVGAADPDVVWCRISSQVSRTNRRERESSKSGTHAPSVPYTLPTVNAPVLQFLVIAVAGWIQRGQQNTIEYLVEENRVLREQLGKRRLRLTDDQRRRLAVRAKALGRAALNGVACIVTPNTLLRWYRHLVAKKYDGSHCRRPGRPATSRDIAHLVCTMATDNPSWGYTRIQGALFNVGHNIGRNTIKRILIDAGLEPAPERSKRPSWKTFLKAHWGAIAAIDFFTVEALTTAGVVRYFVLFVMDLKSRRVHMAGIVHRPSGAWMEQIARNLTAPCDGFLSSACYLIHDRDPLFTTRFREILASGGVSTIKLPARSPNLNAYAERFVRSARQECLRNLIPLGETHLRTVVAEYVEHYHRERNHQGLDNRLIDGLPEPSDPGIIKCRERLGGTLRYYYREAA